MSYLIKPYYIRNLLSRKLEQHNTETGMLDITVFHEEFKEPLPNALIKVYKISVSGEYNENGAGTLVHQSLTPNNGYLQRLELPVLNELMPGNRDFYFIAIHHPTHHSAYIFNVEIYPNIITSFNVYLNFRYTNEEFFKFNLNPRRSEIISH